MIGKQSTEWTENNGSWMRVFGGLDLRVWPDQDDPIEPWTYEVVLTENDVTEYEIAVGGAADFEEAKAAAEAAVIAWGNDEANAAP